MTQNKFDEMMAWLGEQSNFQQMAMSDQMKISSAMYEMGEKIEPLYDEIIEKRRIVQKEENTNKNPALNIIAGFAYGLFAAAADKRKKEQGILDAPLYLERKDDTKE